MPKKATVAQRFHPTKYYVKLKRLYTGAGHIPEYLASDITRDLDDQFGAWNAGFGVLRRAWQIVKERVQKFDTMGIS